VNQRHRRRVRDALLRYRDEGLLNIVPLCPPQAEAHSRLLGGHLLTCTDDRDRGKVPLGRWKHLQARRTTAEDFRQMLEQAGITRASGIVPNLGAVLGVTSGGIVGIDADGDGAVEWCQVHLGEGPLRTACFRTARGIWHIESW
jgi:hypothetical protein